MDKQVHTVRRTAATLRNSTTNFLTATTLIYAIGAGITAAAGTRLALQLFLVQSFDLHPFQLRNQNGPVLIFIVTTSLCQDWVIYAPAAFLGCGSRFSAGSNCVAAVPGALPKADVLCESDARLWFLYLVQVSLSGRLYLKGRTAPLARAPHQHLVCELHGGGLHPRHLAAGHPILCSFTIRWSLHHLLHAVLPRAAVTKALRDFRISLMVLPWSDCTTSRVLPLHLPVCGGSCRTRVL